MENVREEIKRVAIMMEARLQEFDDKPQDDWTKVRFEDLVQRASNNASRAVMNFMSLRARDQAVLDAIDSMNLFMMVMDNLALLGDLPQEEDAKPVYSPETQKKMDEASDSPPSKEENKGKEEKGDE